MIFKITFTDGQIDWCTAKDMLHLLKSYDEENGLDLQSIESIKGVSEEEAMETEVTNMDYDEEDPDDSEKIPIYDLAVGDDFCIIASTDWQF